MLCIFSPLGDRNPMDFSTRLTLFAKNSPPDCFLNAQTLTGSSPSNFSRKSKRAAKSTLPDFGRGRRTCSRLPARSVLLNTCGIQRSPPETRPLGTRFWSGCLKRKALDMIGFVKPFVTISP